MRWRSAPRWRGHAAHASRASRGSARRACSPSSPRAPTRAAISCSPGRAAELERDLPFWVFVDALDEYVAGLDPRRLDAPRRRVARRARARLPVAPGSRPAAATSLQDERYRSHRAVRELLERLAATQAARARRSTTCTGPTRRSIELLGALLRRPPAGAGAARARVAPAPGARAARGGARARRPPRRAHPLRARRRCRGEAPASCSATRSGATSRRLYEESGGNPFYLEQLARSHGSVAGDRAGVDGAALEASTCPQPWSPRSAEELALLSAGTRRVLEGAAVAGDPFEPELAAAAAGVDDGDRDRRARRAAAARPRPPTDVPRRFRFRHPLVRRAVYEATPGGWRLGAHERSADALAARGAPAAARAHHVEHSAAPGRRATRSRCSAEAGERGAPARAGQRRALVRRRPAPAAARPRRRGAGRAAARRSRGALAATGPLRGEPRRAAREHRARPRRGGGAARAADRRLRRRRAPARPPRGGARPPRARARRARDPTPREAVALMIELAVDSLYRAGLRRAARLGERALAGGARARRPAAGRRGAGDRSRSACAFAGAIADASGATTRPRRSSTRCPTRSSRRGSTRSRTSRGGDATSTASTRRAPRRARAGARARDRPGRALPTLHPGARAAPLAAGPAGEAAERARRRVEAARLAGNAQGLAWNLLNRSLRRRVTGRHRDALATAEESVELARALDESVALRLARAIVARAARRRGGRPGRAPPRSSSPRAAATTCR